jgi:hypothetical protein
MIKNKNGEEYKISKPNPLMKYQDLWNIYTLHNFFWNETIEENKKQIKENINKINEQIEEKEEIEEIEQEIEAIEIVEKDIIQEIGVECYYLEAENTSFLDNLYGDKKTKIKYTQKKIININIDSYNDLFLYFTHDKKLEKNSIIFPKNKDKRWWKINKVKKEEEKDYSYECIPSDFTPSFV